MVASRLTGSTAIFFHHGAVLEEDDAVFVLAIERIGYVTSKAGLM
jgi:hypothetical protein